MRFLPHLFCFVLGLALPVQAQTKPDITATTQKARDFASEGKSLEALDALDEAALQVWEAMPLAVRKALFVVEEPQGFGLYNARENAIFDGSTSLLIYAELAGHGWKRSGNLWRTDLVLSFELKSKSGDRLVAQEAFNTIATSSRTRNREFFLHVSYAFTGLDNGDYVVTTSIKDKAGNKSGEFSLDFTVKK